MQFIEGKSLSYSMNYYNIYIHLVSSLAAVVSGDLHRSNIH